jgi:hypothetical protein
MAAAYEGVAGPVIGGGTHSIGPVREIEASSRRRQREREGFAQPE